MARTWRAAAALVFAASFLGAASAPRAPAPGNRIASVFISQDLINELIQKHLDTPMLKDVSLTLDPDQDEIAARGIVKIPVDEMKAVNLEKGLSEFRFQVTIKPKTTPKGHLILVFPLEQTYFYPAHAKDPEKERVIIPVQFLSLALAQARGYLAALSGDYSGFERKVAQLREQIARLDRQLKQTKDPDERDSLKNERIGAELQLSALPIERKQIQKVAKELESLLGFTGEKEINLNQELAARRNALILRIKISQLAPYLAGVELGGVRILRDTKDGSGMNFLAVDVNAQLEKFEPPVASSASARAAASPPPEIVIRLNQALFESEAVVAAEAKEVGSRASRLGLDFKEDGLHAHGRWHIPIFPDIPFGTVVKFVWTAPNVFELRVERARIEHIDVKALAGLVLDLAKSRLNKSLKGACSFAYVGQEADGSRALRVTVDMPQLLPAFPDLALTGIVTRNRELLLKFGKP